MSKWIKHVDKWKDCTECGLCERRTQVVLARGILPCDVLYIGEAPGQSEDVLGIPFVGPAGKLLDHIDAQAFLDAPNLTRAFSNLIACIPLGEYGAKVDEPPKESILACAERLVELVEMAQPKIIVCVGKLSSKWTRSILGDAPYVWCDITHPAAILRMVFVSRGLAVQEAIVTIIDAIEEQADAEGKVTGVG